MIERLARACYSRRRFVLAGWILLVVVLSGLGSSLAEEFRTEFELPGAESQAAADLLQKGGFGGRAGSQTGQIVFMNPRSSEVRGAMEGFFESIEREVEGTEIFSPYDARNSAQISRDGSLGFAEIDFGEVTFDESTKRAEEVVELRDAVTLPSGLQVEFGGDMFAGQGEFSSEAFGLAAAIVILLIAFGSLLAMGLPLITALFGIACGFAIVQLATRVLDVPNFTPAAVAMIAIGVGIDYALFVVTRYREELSAGLEPQDAVVRSLGTAGKSVIFAGTTVVISLLGLLLVGQASTQALAVAAAAGVFMVMLASITLLPALLGFVGRNIDRLGLPHRRRRPSAGHASFWARWSRVIQRRPWPVAVAGFAVLLALAAPVLSMRLGFSDAGNRPDTQTTRRAYDLVADAFGPGFNGPLFLAVDLPGDKRQDAAALGRLDQALRADPGVALATPPALGPDGNVALVQVFPKTSPQDEATDRLVDRLRDKVAPSVASGTQADVLVGGGPAIVADFSAFQSSKLPLFIGAVLALSFILLLVVFRSVLVPLKAVVMNMLSIGAAYGVIVATFQWGWGGSLLGIGEPGPVEAWAPMMLFAIIFGLSMDYEVFLLSRIKEEYDRDRDNARAVADGLAKTARLITAAAAIMFFVFAGFVLSSDRALQLFGLGLAVAVLVDATIIRLVLVPATMELLGDRNWWLPSGLNRLVPKVAIEGRPPANGQRRPIGYWLKQADKAISGRFDAVFEDNGLSRRHWRVLNVIRASETAGRRALHRTLAPFAGAAEIDEVLDDLAARGWIERSRRGFVLTEDGIAGHGQVRRLVSDVRKLAVAGIPERDYTTTIATLERIIANLDGNGDRPGRVAVEEQREGEP